MQSLIPAQVGLLAEGFGEIIGPILIFGIYIIASIAKAASKKGRSETGNEETESALKKAVRQRYQEIYQKQMGQHPPKPLRQQKPPQFQPRPVQKAAPVAQQRSQWELRQEAIRQQNATIQRPKPPVEYSKPNILSQIAAAAAAKPPRPKPASVQKAQQAEAPKKHMKQPAKIAKDSQIQTAGVSLHAMTKDPKNLRAAFILKEIIDKPVALREY